MSAPAWLDELSLGAGPPWHTMGTRALADAEWLLPPDADADEQLRIKRTLLETSHDVVAAKSSCTHIDGAVEETAALVAAATATTLAADRPALEAAALLVQEDLCVLVDHDGQWRLEAGVVCFPSLWRLSDKIGLPITAIHEPVPFYADELAARVDRFIDQLRADRPVWRRNWFVHDSPELHLPQSPAPSTRLLRIPDELWLRSERQTLRRLPRTGAVVFTIRTQQVPLAVLTERPDVATALAGAVRAWSPELVGYRSAEWWRDAATAWLEHPASCG